MRMWLVDPRIMCRQHLLGEHRELHSFIGTLKKRLSVKGYLQNNLLQLNLLYSRHEELVKEMSYRGYNHRSVLPVIDLSFYDKFFNITIDVEKSKKELLRRCKRCRDLTK